jgi:hypothetical protein
MQARLLLAVLNRKWLFAAAQVREGCNSAVRSDTC